MLAGPVTAGFVVGVGRGVEGFAEGVGRVGGGLVGRLVGSAGVLVVEGLVTDGGDDCPAGSVSLHPTSAVTSTNAPTSLTLRR